MALERLRSDDFDAFFGSNCAVYIDYFFNCRGTRPFKSAALVFLGNGDFVLDAAYYRRVFSDNKKWLVGLDDVLVKGISDSKLYVYFTKRSF